VIAHPVNEMAHEESIREVVDRVAEWLRDGLAAELAHLADEVAARTREQTETELRSALEQETARRIEAARAEVERAARERLEAAVAAARAEAGEQTEARLNAVRAEAERILAIELDQARREAEERTAEAVAAARRDAASAVRASIDRLLQAIDRLDAATSLSEVLTRVADGAATEAGRVAVFLVQGGRVRGWRVAGFGAASPDPKTVDLPVAEAGPIGRAVETAAVSRLAGPAPLMTSETPPFGPLAAGQSAVAAPILVGGRVVAVLYADDVGGPRREVSAVWPQAVEVLARYAGRCLEALTALRTVQVAFRPSPAPAIVAAPGGGRSSPGAASPAVSASTVAAGVVGAAEEEVSAQRYARLLVSEIKLYHETKVRQGREHRDLLRRLGPEIERARRLYEERVPAEIRARTSYFEQELVRTLAEGDPGLLGEVR
jgi:hypothetical protein